MSESVSRIPNLTHSFVFDSARTWLLLIAIVLLLGAVYVGQSSQAVITGQRINDKQERLDRILRENAQLEADVAVALAPNRVDARARALGLHLPNPEQIKYLTVKDYPVEMVQSVPAGSSQVTGSSASGMFDLAAWLTDIPARLSRMGSRAAEATTNP